MKNLHIFQASEIRGCRPLCCIYCDGERTVLSQHSCTFLWGTQSSY